MASANSYGERLNRAREEKGLSMGALARRSGYPLDLVEPLLKGTPIVVSEQMNNELCEALELDAREMWHELRDEVPRKE